MTDLDLTRLWRERTSSEGQPPRVLIRVFVWPDDLGDAIDFYEELQGVRADAIFPYPEVGLSLAMVGSFLVVSGTDEALVPFRSTTGTLLVDEVQPYRDRLVAAGGRIVKPLHEVPTGSGLTVEHPDGTVVEYVQHRPTAAERDDEGPATASR
ncbi:VOC family protein [Solicola sp. PLA-1-18]|uniref:VOC family protein n=1 Tax=Solicola sp. PLA-1-18 TaxID=3380532 RepID=UPI003B7DB27B